MINRTVFFHYRTQVLCRVSQTLGKGRKTLGKLLVECSTRQSAHGLSSTGEAGFAECLFSGTRQTFAVCQVALGKKSWNGTDGRTGELANGTANWRTGRPNGTGRKLCRVPYSRHSAKIQTSPSANLAALGEVWVFAECQASGTRRSLDLCRVSRIWHSAKFGSLPSVRRPALGEVLNFAECQGNYTRQIRFPGNRKMVALPSVRVKTLGKACCFFIFFLFLCINHIHHHKKNIYTFQTSVTVYIWHIHHIITQISHVVSHEYHK